MRALFENSPIRKAGRRLLWTLCACLAALALEPALPAAPSRANALPLAEDVAARLPSLGADMLDPFGDVAPAWLGKAQHVSKEILVNLLVNKPQLAKQIADRLEKGYEVPYVSDLRLRVQDQQVLLEYRF